MKAFDEVVLQIGPIGKIKNLIIVGKIPKTRSGKIVGSLIRKILKCNIMKSQILSRISMFWTC